MDQIICASLVQSCGLAQVILPLITHGGNGFLARFMKIKIFSNSTNTSSLLFYPNLVVLKLEQYNRNID